MLDPFRDAHPVKIVQSCFIRYQNGLTLSSSSHTAKAYESLLALTSDSMALADLRIWGLRTKLRCTQRLVNSHVDGLGDECPNPHPSFHTLRSLSMWEVDCVEGYLNREPSATEVMIRFAPFPSCLDPG